MPAVADGCRRVFEPVDIRPELDRLATSLTFHWIEQASKGLDQVYTGMRRNLLRNLSLDAYATQLVSG